MRSPASAEIHRMRGPALLLAGPGTGKTYQLAKRIKFLVEDEQVDPSNIAVITFTAAAALALVDQPWSRAELLAVLSESSEQEPTSECRAGLIESRDPDVRRPVAEWEERNPHEAEVGRFISMSEVMLRQAPDWMQYEMDRLRDRVLPLQDREPPR